MALREILRHLRVQELPWERQTEAFGWNQQLLLRRQGRQQRVSRQRQLMEPES
jgi:hypothetical protein